jgi:chaperonin GroES
MQGGTPLPGIDPSQMAPQPLPNQLGAEAPEEGMPEEEKESLRKLLETANIAEKLSDDELQKIGQEAKAGYELDKESRTDWERDVDEWTKLAKQTRDPKSYPWTNASNVKYPLLTTAAMQFAARSYPSLVPSDGKVVKSKVIGKDPTGEKFKLADRVSLYMSYQLMHEVEGWEESMDKLLIMLPIMGTVFKKTYFDHVSGKPCSEMIHPSNLVVNYWAKTLQTAERVSHVIEMSPRILKERQLKKIYRDVDLKAAPMPMSTDRNQPSKQDETTPYTLIEQHTYLDLDDDGYREPYIVVFHLESGEVLRVQARFDEKGMIFDDDDNLVSIKATQYFTKFGFIPNPDGGFYDIGFGVLLGPLNESVNTLINQMIDSGSLANLQAGFLGKGLKIRMGSQPFQPGEWKMTSSTGDDLRKQIVPLPTKDPSPVLLQLMGSLITSGKELASVAEIFVGKMPGQNTPATTTMATIEQGMKVFTAVYKRIYRSLQEEFTKLFEINGTYLNPNTYADIVDVTVGPDDFNSTQYNICPGADPTAVSQTERLLKAQGLMEMLPLGILDPVKVGLRILEAQEQPNFQDLLLPQVAQTGQPPPPPPDPKLMETEAKIKALQEASAIKRQEATFKSELAARDQSVSLAMKAAAADQDARSKDMLARTNLAVNVSGERARSAQERQKFIQDTIHKEVDHRQKVRHNEQAARTKNQAQRSKEK